MEADEPSMPTQYSAQNIFYDELPFRIEGGKLQEIIHRSVVALTFLNVHKKIGAGSGALISRDTVLTAAHNLYQRQLRTNNSNFKIYIGANGIGEEYHQVEGWRYPQQFQNCAASAQLAFDYAILKLKKPVEFDQFLKIAPAYYGDFIKDNQKAMLQVYGFPRAYPPDHQGIIRPYMGNFEALDQFGKRIRLYQYGLARQGRISVVDTSQLKIGYGISTLPGQSGSPVVIGNEIIAVHAGGEIGKKFNVGRIIDETLLKNVAEWGKQLNAAPFNLEEPQLCKDNLPKTHCTKQQIAVFNSKQQISVKTNPATTLELVKKGLQSVDLQEYVNLLNLYLWENKLKLIDLSHCPSLTKINLSNNELRTINLANNIHLTCLSMVSNQLQSIDLSANTDLTQLYLQSNKIIQIDLTKNTKLEWLWLRNNKLARVRLWIAQNVQEEIYISKFSFSHQQSAACRVQLMCKAQTKQKAMRIAKKKKSEYKVPLFPIFINTQNKHRCSYSFEVV